MAELLEPWTCPSQLDRVLIAALTIAWWISLQTITRTQDCCSWHQYMPPVIWWVTKADADMQVKWHHSKNLQETTKISWPSGDSHVQYTIPNFPRDNRKSYPKFFNPYFEIFIDLCTQVLCNSDMKLHLVDWNNDNEHHNMSCCCYFSDTRWVANTHCTTYGSFWAFMATGILLSSVYKVNTG